MVVAILEKRNTNISALKRYLIPINSFTCTTPGSYASDHVSWNSQSPSTFNMSKYKHNAPVTHNLILVNVHTCKGLLDLVMTMNFISLLELKLSTHSHDDVILRTFL